MLRPRLVPRPVATWAATFLGVVTLIAGLGDDRPAASSAPLAAAHGWIRLAHLSPTPRGRVPLLLRRPARHDGAQTRGIRRCLPLRAGQGGRVHGGGGAFDAATKTYLSNVVVFTTEVGARRR